MFGFKGSSLAAPVNDILAVVRHRLSRVCLIIVFPFNRSPPFILLLHILSLMSLSFCFSFASLCLSLFRLPLNGSFILAISGFRIVNCTQTTQPCLLICLQILSGVLVVFLLLFFFSTLHDILRSITYCFVTFWSCCLSCLLKNSICEEHFPSTTAPATTISNATITISTTLTTTTKTRYNICK